MWLEIKRYSNDPINNHFTLDIYDLDASLDRVDGEYTVRCQELDIDQVIDHDLVVSQRIAIKIIIHALSKRAARYDLIKCSLQKEV